MTVQSEVSRSGPYAGAGTTGPFTVGFRFLADSHLRVIRTSAAGVDTDLVLTTDYSVTGAGNDTGTVTLVVALPIGASLTIIRDVPFTQEADYVDNDSFPAESHEAALDLLTMQTQQIREAQDRAVALSPTSIGVSTELPPALPNNLIGWNSAGNGLQNLDPANLAGLVSYGSFRVDVFNGDGTTIDFLLIADALVAANCDVVVGGVSQTPDVNYEYLPATKTIRFKTGAPPAGIDNVFVRYGSVLDVGYASAVDGQTSIGTALIKAADTASARSAIGATAVGSAVFTAASTAAARSALGAGTFGDALFQASTQAAAAALLAPPRGYISGLITANNVADMTNDIDIGVGQSADSTSTLMMTLSTGVTRQLDVAYGTGNGGRFDASISDGTWFVFLVSNGITTSVGFSKSLNPSAQPNFPAGYKYRLIWSILRISGVIKPYLQDGDECLWVTTAIDLNGSITATPTSLVVTVPTGIIVNARISARFSGAAVSDAFLYCLAADSGSGMVGYGSAGTATVFGGPMVRTNTSAQIGAVASATITAIVRCSGWVWNRGRDA